MQSSKPLRLLHVVPTYLPATRYGGPIRSVHGICRALADRGHDVHVYTTDVDGSGRSDVPLGTAVDLDGVKVWYFPTGIGRRLYRSPAMAARLRRSIADFDILHLHSVYLWPTTFAARLARSNAIPYVLAPRGMLVTELIARKSRLLKTAFIAAFERANIAEAASVHVTAQIEADEIRRLGLTARRFDVIPNGVELPDQCSDTSSGAPPPEPSRRERWRILTLGRVHWKKGLDRLIPAMRHVGDAELVIAGNDEEGYRSHLEALAQTSGVADKVRFVGPIHGEAKWRLLRSADVFVMPSYSENFGIAALEAMACGRPVVVTPEVGLAQAIRQAGAGIVVDGRPEILGAQIEQLLCDTERRARMGEAGRAAAASTYSWSAIAARMEVVYRQCVSKDSGDDRTPRAGGEPRVVKELG